jgi:hypothetical protein
MESLPDNSEGRALSIRFLARHTLLLWRLGYPLPEGHVQDDGIWRYTFHQMPVRHWFLIRHAVTVADYGPRVFDNEAPERGWGYPLAAHELRVPPDVFLAMYTPLPPLECVRALYCDWAHEFWSNPIVRTMLQRLEALCAACASFTREELTTLVNDMAITLRLENAPAPE